MESIDRSYEHKRLPELSAYLIREDGEVYSLRRKKYLTGRYSKTGLRMFGMTANNGFVFTGYSHNLVAEAFLGLDVYSGLQIQWKDGNRDNNHFSNLEGVKRSSGRHRYR